MPTGPKGEKRPADGIDNAVRVMQIATGEREEEFEPKPAPDFAQRGGLKGGRARAEKLTPEQRREIALAGARKRWAKAERSRSWRSQDWSAVETRQ